MFLFDFLCTELLEKGFTLKGNKLLIKANSFFGNWPYWHWIKRVGRVTSLASVSVPVKPMSNLVISCQSYVFSRWLWYGAEDTNTVSFQLSLVLYLQWYGFQMTQFSVFISPFLCDLHYLPARLLVTHSQQGYSLCTRLFLLSRVL